MNCTISTSDASKPSKQTFHARKRKSECTFCCFPCLSSNLSSNANELAFQRPPKIRPPAPKPKLTEKRPPRERKIWQSFSLAAVYPKQTPLEIGQSPVSVTPGWREPSSEVLLPKGKAIAHLLRGFSCGRRRRTHRRRKRSPKPPRKRPTAKSARSGCPRAGTFATTISRPTGLEVTRPKHGSESGG